MLTEGEASPFAVLAAAQGRTRQLLEGNVVVQVGVERRRLRPRLRRAAAPPPASLEIVAERAARRPPPSRLSSSTSSPRKRCSTTSVV